MLRRRALGHLLMLVGGTGGGQLVVVLASPLLTRLYSPEDFGLLAAYVGLLSPLLVVSSLQYELAVPLPEEDRIASGLVALGLCLVVGLAAVVGVVALTAEGAIATLLNVPDLGPALWALPLGVLAAGVYKVLNYWAVRTRSFPSLARTKLSQGVGTAVSQVGLGVLGLGPVGLIIGDVIGRANGSGTLATLLVRSEQWVWAGFQWSSIREAAVRYRRYPTMVAPGSLLNSVGTHLPVLLLVGLYGVEVAGWFALTHRLIAAPVALLGTAVAQVYLEKAASTARERPGDLGRLYRSALKRLAAVGVPPLLLLGVVAPAAFPIAFGAEWREAGWFAAVLAVPYALQFVAVPLNQMLNVVGREDLLLGWNAIRFVLIGGAVLGGWWWGGSALVTVAAYGAALGGSYVLTIVLTLGAVSDNNNRL